ncbi:hypothetical protein ACSTJL_23735, partial [Vibrio parahaemolyticus]
QPSNALVAWSASRHVRLAALLGAAIISLELAPGGSPYFPSIESGEKLRRELNRLPLDVTTCIL